MVAVDLLVIFNHRHEAVVDRAVDYNRRFADNVVVAAPFSSPGGVQYSSGVWLAQGAIVEYLAQRRFRGDCTLVIHDDLVLNPGVQLSELAVPHGEVLRMYRTQLIQGQMTPTWWWHFRLLANWFTPRSNPFGTGVNDPRELLKSSLLFQQNRDEITRMGVSRLGFGAPPAQISPVLAAWVDAYYPGLSTFNFGLPLFTGNADYLLFPNRLAPEIEDFLRRSIEGGLMSEVAVPTLANWLGLPLRFDYERQILQTGMGWNADITSVAGIEAFFAERPELLSIHPVKFSRFTQ